MLGSPRFKARWLIVAAVFSVVALGLVRLTNWRSSRAAAISIGAFRDGTLRLILGEGALVGLSDHGGFATFQLIRQNAGMLVIVLSDLAMESDTKDGAAFPPLLGIRIGRPGRSRAAAAEGHSVYSSRASARRALRNLGRHGFTARSRAW